MAKGESCKKHDISHEGSCPICNWQFTCEKLIQDVAMAVLVINHNILMKRGYAVARVDMTDGSVTLGEPLKHIDKSEIKDSLAHELTSLANLKSKVELFLNTKPPEIAKCQGLEKNVSEATLRIKQITWDKVSKYLKEIVEYYPSLENLDPVKKIDIFSRSENHFWDFFRVAYSPLPEDPVKTLMVSVVSPSMLLDYIKSFGFKEISTHNLNNIQLEITGGYYSYVRGGKYASAQYVSEFDILPYTFDVIPYTFKEHTTHIFNDVIFGTSVQQDQLEVAHFTSPYLNLLSLLIDIVRDPKAQTHLARLTEDLRIALKWWLQNECTKDFRNFSSNSEVTLFSKLKKLKGKVSILSKHRN